MPSLKLNEPTASVKAKPKIAKSEINHSLKRRISSNKEETKEPKTTPTPTNLHQLNQKIVAKPVPKKVLNIQIKLNLKKVCINK